MRFTRVPLTCCCPGKWPHLSEPLLRSVLCLVLLECFLLSPEKVFQTEPHASLQPFCTDGRIVSINIFALPETDNRRWGTQDKLGGSFFNRLTDEEEITVKHTWKQLVSYKLCCNDIDKEICFLPTLKEEPLWHGTLIFKLRKGRCAFEKEVLKLDYMKEWTLRNTIIATFLWTGWIIKIMNVFYEHDIWSTFKKSGY